MRRLLKTCLLWLMVLALPAQGLAASGRMLCCVGMSSSPVVADNVAAAVPPGHSAVHSHGAEPSLSASTHDDPGWAIDPAATAEQATPDVDPAGPAGHDDGCQAQGSGKKASCCSMAALWSAPGETPPGNNAWWLPAVTRAAVVNFVTDGPDRPPRTRPL